jgi:uncharacterized membrane protein YdbT with pleckstrin-like domain
MRLGVILALINLLAWFMFFALTPRISDAAFIEGDRQRRESHRQAEESGAMIYVTDQPTIIGARAIGSLGDQLAHLLLLANILGAIPATICAALLEANLDVSTKRASYIVAAVLLVGSTVQWLLIGMLVSAAWRRIRGKRPAN